MRHIDCFQDEYHFKETSEMRSEVERQTYFSDEQTERRTNNDSKETKQSQHRCTQNSKIG